MGEITRYCPTRREEYKRKNKRHHAHAIEDEEPPAKMLREQIKDYVLISSLSGSVTPGEDTWLIDSDASKHMTGQRDILSCISEKKFSQNVTLGDDYQYPIKGVGESNYKLNSGTPMKMKDVLYVLDGEVLIWAKGKTMKEAIVIGKEEGGLYKLKGHLEVAMTHTIENPWEL